MAELVNPKSGFKVTGIKPLFLKKSKDALGDVFATKGGGSAESFEEGDSVQISVEILAFSGKGGEKKVELAYNGKKLSHVIEDFKDDQASKVVSLDVPSDILKLSPGRDYKSFVFRVRLFGEHKRPDDTAFVRIMVKKKAANNSSGGLQDVYCSSPDVVLKVWDHFSQDGDTITLTLGQDAVISNFNLDQCGGSEPASGPCVHSRSLAQGSIPVTVFAHNEGSSSPNTATLKVLGGCTPEQQPWGLSTNESGTIQVHYGAQN